ncbi:DUF6642 family protein [Rhodococcus sp. X156]|uniref:DUF6642 family protein n=1 Tax=Rhodococcus sp. X156 TaxID=2499145 RepID=UPI000FD9FD89|nr:DUF6642 family protein [Rhodococcus sp. X156]
MAVLPGIFCLEGEWDGDLRRRDSVLPLLDLLERLGHARSIHRDVATREEFDYYLDKWCQRRYASYDVLYLASHGSSGGIGLGGEASVEIEEIAEQIAGRAEGRIIYFGSCLTLAGEPKQLTDFVKRTGARAAVGYTKEVAWLEGAAFELLLLERMLRGNRSDAFLRALVRDHGKYASDFGLAVATKAKVLHA